MEKNVAPLKDSAEQQIVQTSPQSMEDFQLWYLQAKVPQIRHIAFLTALLFMLYALLEQRMPLNDGVLRLLIHGLLLPVILLIIGIFSFYPSLHKTMRFLLVVAPVGAAFANLYLNSSTTLFAYFAPELYLNIIWTFAISGLTLRYASFTATTTVLLILLMAYIAGFDSQFISLHLLWMLSAFSFGFVSALVLEKAHQAIYLQQCELIYSANSDGLTTLWNRHKMAQLFVYEQARCQRNGQPLSAIMLDIDHFKLVNDTHGHATGDNVLATFATLLRDNIRQVDHVGRIGGEEFLILLPDTDSHQAHIVARGLQEKINQIRFDTAGHLTASLGVTQYKDGESMTQLLTRADKALYLAKTNGRNRIEML